MLGGVYLCCSEMLLHFAPRNQLLVSRGLYIAQGAQLVLLPGTVLLLWSNATVQVDGRLELLGSEEHRWVMDLAGWPTFRYGEPISIHFNMMEMSTLDSCKLNGLFWFMTRNDMLPCVFDKVSLNMGGSTTDSATGLVDLCVGLLLECRLGRGHDNQRICCDTACTHQWPASIHCWQDDR